MYWSWKIGRWAGTDIRVHWTFILLLIWIATSHRAADIAPDWPVENLVLLIGVAVSIVLHETGRALAARRYGILVRSVTLLPIGGMARFDRAPPQPRHEIRIAAAGLLVNLSLGSLIVVYYAAQGRIDGQWLRPTAEAPLAAKLFWANVLLAAVNALPALPMDGGYILRAIMAERMSRIRATQIAAVAGQLAAILLALASIIAFGPLLLVVALAIFLAAEHQSGVRHARALLEGVPVAAVMSSEFRSLNPTDAMQDAFDAMLESPQDDFPIVADGQVLGTVGRAQILAEMRQGGHTLPVANYATADCQSVDEHALLADVLTSTFSTQCRSVIVLREEKVVGMLSLSDIGALMIVGAKFESSDRAGMETVAPQRES